MTSFPDRKLPFVYEVIHPNGTISHAIATLDYAPLSFEKSIAAHLEGKTNVLCLSAPSPQELAEIQEEKFFYELKYWHSVLEEMPDLIQEYDRLSEHERLTFLIDFKNECQREELGHCVLASIEDVVHETAIEKKVHRTSIISENQYEQLISALEYYPDLPRLRQRLIIDSYLNGDAEGISVCLGRQRQKWFDNLPRTLRRIPTAITPRIVQEVQPFLAQPCLLALDSDYFFASEPDLLTLLRVNGLKTRRI